MKATNANDNRRARPARFVRQFSACGPCITKGELIRETDKFYIYRERFGAAGEPYGAERRVSKAARGKWSKVKVHVEPCPSCTDHPQTQYPNGYMD